MRLQVGIPLISMLIAGVNSAILPRVVKRAAAHSARPVSVAEPLARQASGPGLKLPAGAELVLGDYVQTTFSCEDEEHQRYGYYADVDNNCQVFHVCNPVQLPTSKKAARAEPDVMILQYSFFCGNGTVFDQLSMTCAFEDDAIPCSNAPDFYYLNENLGVEDAFHLTDEDVAKKAKIIEEARGKKPEKPVEISPPMDESEQTEATTTRTTGRPTQPSRDPTPAYGRRQQSNQRPKPQQKSKPKRFNQQQQQYAIVTTTASTTLPAEDVTERRGTFIL